MNKRGRRRYGEVIDGAIRDARAGDHGALEFLQVAAPDLVETLHLSSSVGQQVGQGEAILQKWE